MTWDHFFMGLAEHAAQKSKDRSTKVGAVLVDPKSKAVLSLGYNGFPRGCDDERAERHNRPLKYKWTEHAERNAIYNAARNGVRLEGSVLYSTLFPCTDCARAIVQAGIYEVVVPCAQEYEFGARWADDFAVSDDMLAEAGVKVRGEDI